MAPGGVGAGVADTGTASAVGTDSVVATAIGVVTATAAAMLDAEVTAEQLAVTREEHAADSAAELHAADLVAEEHAVDSAAAVMVAAVDTAKIHLRG